MLAGAAPAVAIRSTTCPLVSNSAISPAPIPVQNSRPSSANFPVGKLPVTLMGWMSRVVPSTRVMALRSWRISTTSKSPLSRMMGHSGEDRPAATISMVASFGREVLVWLRSRPQAGHGGVEGTDGTDRGQVRRSPQFTGEDVDGLGGPGLATGHQAV